MYKQMLHIFLFVAFCGKDVLCKRHKMKRNEGRIVGGNDTTIQSYPYQAYLLLYDGMDYYQCGGSIVSENYIVTAAHCLTGIQTIYVRIGSTNSRSGGSEYQTDLFNSHPFYNASTSDYDVGVVQVDGMDLDGKNAKAISLIKPGSDVMDGKEVVMTGWGATSILDYYQCGGSIVSENYIVTAAHCLTGIQTIYVRIGSTNSRSGGSEYQTDLFNSHPFYNASTSDYDVGVVQVDGMDLDGKNAKAISLIKPGSDVMDGKEVVMTGWGATSENGDVSNTLMKVSVPAVGRDRCNKLLGGGITTRMFCAGLAKGGKDTCQGDSGGPAVTDGKLAGITSFGYGCARPDSPGVYTLVGNLAIRLFIQQRTGLKL